jgi:hypothetical protein
MAYFLPPIFRRVSSHHTTQVIAMVSSEMAVRAYVILALMLSQIIVEY